MTDTSVVNKYVQRMITMLKDEFDLDDPEVMKALEQPTASILSEMLSEVRNQSMEKVSVAVQNPTKLPQIKKVTKLSLFRTRWEADHPDQKDASDVVDQVKKALSELSAEDQKELAKQVRQENKRILDEYRATYGRAPPTKEEREQATMKKTTGFQEFRAVFQADHKDLNMIELSKQVSKAYKELSDEVRQRYIEQAKTKNAEYRAEFEKRMADKPELLMISNANKTSTKKERVPKPTAYSGYSVFGTEWRKKHDTKGQKPTEVLKKIGADWASLTEKKKEPYKKKAKAQTEASIATFIKESPDAVWTVKYNERQAKESS